MVAQDPCRDVGAVQKSSCGGLGSGVRDGPDSIASVGYSDPADDELILICGADVEERFRRIGQISRYGYCLFDRGAKLLTGDIAYVFDNRNSNVMTSQGAEQVGLRQLKVIDVGTKAFAIKLQCLRNGNLAEEHGRN